MRTIQTICNNCGATMYLEKNRGYSRLQCPYCRGSMNLLMESDRVKIAEIRADTDRLGMEYSYRKHRDHLALDWAMQNSRVLLVGVAAVVIIIMIAAAGIRNRDRIKVPFSSRDLNGKAYQDARTMLKDAGFSDIEVIARGDLWDGFLHNDQGNIGKVAQVTINGDEKFRENDSYHKTAKIRIWHHTYP